MKDLGRTIRVALLGLAAASPARAWEAGEASSWPTPGEATALVAGRWGDRAALVLVGPSASWVVDPGTGAVLATAAGATAALLVDHDGDGASDLLLCGPAGVGWARADADPLAPIVPLTTEPCAALAPLAPEEGGRALVTASDAVLVWTVGPGGALEGPERFGARLGGPPLLATSGPRLAAAAVGGNEVQERSEWGRSTYTSRGPIGGLVAGPRSWAWSIPAAGVVADVTRKEVGVAPSAGGLRQADLDGDGLVEVLVLHPDAIGVIASDVETVLAAPGARDVAAADLDGDGCGDVAVLADGDVRVTRGRCAAPAIVEAGGVARDVVLDNRDQVIDAWVGQPLRVRLRDPLGEGTQFSGRGGPEGFRVAEDGLVTWIPAPDDVGEWSVSVRMWGGADLVRVVPVRLVVHRTPAAGPGPEEPTSLALGEDVPTLQVLVGETAVVRLQDAVGEATTFRWRGGPPGLQIRSDGLARYTGLQEHVGEWRVDLVLRGNGPRRRAAFTLRVAPRSIVTAPPGSPAAAEAERQAGLERQPRFLQPRGCMVSLGFAGGVTDTRESWANLGRPVYVSFSPVVAGTCEGGPPGGLQWFAGADSAPLYAYLLNEDALGVHTLVATIGLSVGGDAFRIGPYAAAGILVSGAGVRAWWLPFVTRGGIPHGFELRAAYLFAATPSAQAMLMYGWRFGRPR